MTPNHTKCSSCGAAIFFAQTFNGRSMPIDEAPVESGNIYLTGDLAHVMKADETPPHGMPLYKSHFATCKHSASHRKAK